jgi:hypothetical protein
VKFILSNLLFFLILLQDGICQTNFVDSEIVSIDGDTIKGFIDYRDWSSNPKKISFKRTVSSSSETLNPTSIRSFRVNEVCYMSAIVNVKTFSSKHIISDDSPVPKTNIDTVFLQAIYQGAKSLFYYKNSSGSNFYIIQNQKFELLVYKKYLKYTQGGKKIAENKKFIGQLSYYLNDCPSIKGRIKTVRYNIKSIKNVFDYYYKSKGHKPQFANKKENIEIEVGLNAGSTVSIIEFKSDNNKVLVNTNYNPSVNFSGGISANLILPRNHKKWSIYADLIYTRYSFEGSYVDYLNENNYTITETGISFSYFKINTMLRFTYPMRNFQIFLNGGLSNGLGRELKNVKIRNATFYQTNNISIEEAIGKVRINELGYTLGVGVKRKRFLFEYRFEYGDGMSADMFLGAKLIRHYILLGYLLNK